MGTLIILIVQKGNRMKNINDLQKRFITIRTSRGDIKNYSIKQFIPMQMCLTGTCGIVEDVEVLLDRKNNIYFSINMFLNEESWVKDFWLHPQKDKRIKTLPIIPKYKKPQMSGIHYDQTNVIIGNWLKEQSDFL